MFTIGTRVKCVCGCNTEGIFQYAMNNDICILREIDGTTTFEMPINFLVIVKKSTLMINYVTKNPKNLPDEKKQ